MEKRGGKLSKLLIVYNNRIISIYYRVFLLFFHGNVLISVFKRVCIFFTPHCNHLLEDCIKNTKLNRYHYTRITGIHFIKTNFKVSFSIHYFPPYWIKMNRKNVSLTYSNFIMISTRYGVLNL